jgi:hypothetical protein
MCEPAVNKESHSRRNLQLQHLWPATRRCIFACVHQLLLTLGVNCVRRLNHHCCQGSTGTAACCCLGCLLLCISQPTFPSRITGSSPASPVRLVAPCHSAQCTSLLETPQRPWQHAPSTQWPTSHHWQLLSIQQVSDSADCCKRRWCVMLLPLQAPAVADDVCSMLPCFFGCASLVDSVHGMLMLPCLPDCLNCNLQLVLILLCLL